MNKCYGIALISMVMVGSVVSQELTGTQEDELMAIGLDYVRKETQLENQIDAKLTELAVELTRKGRLDSQEQADESADRIDEILKSAGALYGEYIETRVEHMLMAKNVLTLEQKLALLMQLQPARVMNYSEIEHLQPDMFELPLGLDVKQRKELIDLKADLLIKEIKLERDIEFTLLKIETELMEETIDSKKVDKQVMALAKLASKAIENRVDFVLDAKDELTLEQKRILAELMGLN